MTENLKWEFKKKLNAAEQTKQIGEFAKKIVARELDDINAQIDTLHKMGLIKDCKELRNLKTQMKKLKIESEEVK